MRFAIAILIALLVTSGQAATNTTSRVAKAVNNATDSVSKGAKDAWQATKNWGTNVWSKTKTGAQSATDAMRDAAEEARVNIVELFTEGTKKEAKTPKTSKK